MKLSHLAKTILLRLKGDNLGKEKYKLTAKDVFIKLFRKKKKLTVKCVIAGFPRSGTHWIRNVVEKTTNSYCPSLDDVNYSKVNVQQEISFLKFMQGLQRL